MQFRRDVKDDEKLARWAKRETVPLVGKNWDLSKIVARDLHSKGTLDPMEIEKLIPGLMNVNAARLKKRMASTRKNRHRFSVTGVTIFQPQNGCLQAYRGVLKRNSLTERKGIG